MDAERSSTNPEAGAPPKRTFRKPAAQVNVVYADGDANLARLDYLAKLTGLNRQQVFRTLVEVAVSNEQMSDAFIRAALSRKRST
jgi:hypothetical protein